MQFRTIGSPETARLEFDSPSQVLSCISTGGPITTISWKRNEILLTGYDRTQRIDDISSATYVNTLSLDGEYPRNVIGSYECLVSNARGTAHAQFRIHG